MCTRFFSPPRVFFFFLSWKWKWKRMRKGHLFLSEVSWVCYVHLLSSPTNQPFSGHQLESIFSVGDENFIIALEKEEKKKCKLKSSMKIAFSRATFRSPKRRHNFSINWKWQFNSITSAREPLVDTKRLFINISLKRKEKKSFSFFLSVWVNFKRPRHREIKYRDFFLLSLLLIKFRCEWVSREKNWKQNSLIAYGIPSADRPILALIKRRLSRIKCVHFVDSGI